MPRCGEYVDKPGVFVPTKPGTCGYCRVDEQDAPLVDENGVWTCQADSEMMDHV